MIYHYSPKDPLSGPFKLTDDLLADLFLESGIWDDEDDPAVWEELPPAS